METPIIKITEIEQSSNNKFVIHNQALSEIEVYGIASVIGAQSIPPVSPSIGDFYIVLDSPTGAWSGQANSLTVYNGTGWNFYLPNESVLIRDSNTGRDLGYTGTEWISKGGEDKLNYTLAADVALNSIDSKLQVIDPSGTLRNVTLPLPTDSLDFTIVNDSDNLSASGNTVNVLDNGGLTIAVLDDTTDNAVANLSWSVAANKWVIW